MAHRSSRVGMNYCTRKVVAETIIKATGVSEYPSQFSDVVSARKADGTFKTVEEMEEELRNITRPVRDKVRKWAREYNQSIAVQSSYRTLSGLSGQTMSRHLLPTVQDHVVTASLTSSIYEPPKPINSSDIASQATQTQISSLVSPQEYITSDMYGHTIWNNAPYFTGSALPETEHFDKGSIDYSIPECRRPGYKSPYPDIR